MNLLGNIKYCIAAFLLMLAIISCDKSEVIPTEPVIQTVTLSANIENKEQEFDVTWNTNDAIAVVNNGKLYRFVLSSNDTDSSCMFVMDRTALPENYTEGDFDSTATIKAFYPYNGVTYDTTEHVFNYAVPAQQKYVNSSLDKGLIPLVGHAKNILDELTFYKLFGVLKFSIVGNEGEYIKKIEINSSNKVNGMANVKIEESDGNSPDIFINILKETGKGESNIDHNKIVLDFDSDISISDKAVDFHIALPESAKDLGIIFHTSERSYYKSVSSYNEDGEYFNIINAGKLNTLPQINATQMNPAYIEKGIYLGDGIVLPKTADGTETIIWAPVNCGYESEVKNGGQIAYKGYPYGKIYQWGRKDGQGYMDNSYEDATYPYVPSVLGNESPDPAKFYENWSLATKEWPATSNPCPDGWRVPTIEEMLSLVTGLSQNDYLSGLEELWTTSNTDLSNRHYGLPGFEFYGNTNEYGTKVFFPAGGFYKYDLNGTQIRGLSGCYWSSSANGEGYAWYFDFNRKGYIDTYYDSHANGRSVRCVKSM